MFGIRTAMAFCDVQQSDEQAMRGRLTATAESRFWFWSIESRWYPVSNDGPVGKMLEAQGWHPNRSAHVHFMNHAPGHEMLLTHALLEGDPYLDSDVVFGVKDSLMRAFIACDPGRAAAPDGRKMAGPYDFALKALPNLRDQEMSITSNASTTV